MKSYLLPFFDSVCPPGLALATAFALVAELNAQAGVTSFGAFKGKNYIQQAANSVVTDSEDAFDTYFFVHTAEAEELVLASVKPQGAAVPTFLSPDLDDGTHHTLNQSFSTLAELNAAAPNGSFAFELFDEEFNTLHASLTIAGDAYPAGTGISNYADAQKIDPTKAFTFQWTPPAGLGANDYVVVEVWGDSGSTQLAATSFPWEANALPGTTTSYTIPAGTLTGEDLELILLFIKVAARDTTTLAGATGLAGYFASAQVDIKLSSGGGGDTLPPILIGSVPAPQATGVPPGNPLVLTFSEPMQPTQTVNWVNVPNAATIAYTWSNGGRTLSCTAPGGFPASTLVIWSLNPAGFTDLAGNKLTGIPGGFFTTDAQTTDPCEDVLAAKTDFFFAIKEVSYEQSSSADPVEGGTPVASFGSFFEPAAGTSVSAASVRLPNGDVRNLSVFAGKYFLQAPTNSEAALTAAYPAGGYFGAVTISGVTGNLALLMPGAPPVPKCLNYAAAQGVDPAKDFTLQWNPFTGAAGNDRILIFITDDTGKAVYSAPDDCANPPRSLSSGATSTVLGAGLLSSGKTYHVELRFMKVSAFASQTGPTYQGGAGFSKINRFTLKTTGGNSGGTLRIKGYQLLGSGSLQLTIEAPVQQTLSLEASSDFVTWATVGGSIAGADGTALLTDTRGQIPSPTFYRVRMP